MTLSPLPVKHHSSPGRMERRNLTLASTAVRNTHNPEVQCMKNSCQIWWIRDEVREGWGRELYCWFTNSRPNPGACFSGDAGRSADRERPVTEPCWGLERKRRRGLHMHTAIAAMTQEEFLPARSHSPPAPSQTCRGQVLEDSWYLGGDDDGRKNEVVHLCCSMCQCSIHSVLPGNLV